MSDNKDNRAIVSTDQGGELQAANFERMASDYLKSLGSNLKNEDRIKFIHLCKYYQLDPFRREIYGIPYGNKFNIIIGYEVFLKRAEKHPELEGWGVRIEGAGDDMRATIEIDRKGWKRPFSWEVDFVEYDLANSMWKSKPKTMLKKVAIAQGFRLCFANDYGGMPYIEDELETAPPEPPQEPQQKPQQPKPSGRSLSDYLDRLNQIENPFELKAWSDKYRQQYQTDLNKADQKTFQNHLQAKRAQLANWTKEKTADTGGNRVDGNETFACSLDGQAKTHAECDGLKCRETCEHFNKD